MAENVTNPIDRGDFYEAFTRATAHDLEERLLAANSREEKIFYRKLLNLKLQLEQEKVIGELLL
ncbi:MAG: hypothetical protein IJR90_03795 [Clostridia bacterium]|nr:hypothetical protein [Clostridia bacterium]MBQ9879509.1 hypothetical protein [Clostridia bacterium]